MAHKDISANRAKTLLGEASLAVAKKLGSYMLLGSNVRLYVRKRGAALRYTLFGDSDDQIDAVLNA